MRLPEKKQSRQGTVVVKIYISYCSTGNNFWRFGHPPFPATEREIPLQMESYFFFNKCKYQKGHVYPVFRVFLSLLLLKNH